MLAVATTEDDVARVLARLDELGTRTIDVVAPGGTRRVVLAAVDDAGRTESLAVALRADGVMAVTRPDGGPALRTWHHNTTPLTIRDRLSICRAWSEHPRHELPGLIELGPGGFGSGDHPSTRLLIDQLVKRLAGHEWLLDVGCGSGVLGLAALELGARRVTAVDVKPEAVEATRRNAALNGMHHRLEAIVEPLTALDGAFDVVVANIARAGIVALAADLVSRTAPGGWLAVSGITPSQCSPVAEFLAPLVEVERRSSSDDWSVLVLARPVEES